MAKLSSTTVYGTLDVSNNACTSDLIAGAGRTIQLITDSYDNGQIKFSQDGGDNFCHVLHATSSTNLIVGHYNAWTNLTLESQCDPTYKDRNQCTHTILHTGNANSKLCDTYVNLGAYNFDQAPTVYAKNGSSTDPLINLINCAGQATLNLSGHNSNCGSFRFEANNAGDLRIQSSYSTGGYDSSTGIGTIACFKRAGGAFISGTTCTPTLYASTRVCSPVICGTTCVRGGRICASNAGMYTAGAVCAADPMSTSDWNANWLTGFYEGNSASNAPSGCTGWFWGLKSGHTSNSSTYQYGMDLVIRNDSPYQSYIRRTDAAGTGTWQQIYTSGNNNIGTGATNYACGSHTHSYRPLFCSKTVYFTSGGCNTYFFIGKIRKSSSINGYIGFRVHQHDDQGNGTTQGYNDGLLSQRNGCMTCASYLYGKTPSERVEVRAYCNGTDTDIWAYAHDYNTSALEFTTISGADWVSDGSCISGQSGVPSGTLLFSSVTDGQTHYTTCNKPTKSDVGLGSVDNAKQLRTQCVNGYWGMVDGAGSAGSYIRTTTAGIIPYCSNSSSGNGSLGTSTWPFVSVHSRNVYQAGEKVYSPCNRNIGTGATNYACGSHLHSTYVCTTGCTQTIAGIKCFTSQLCVPFNSCTSTTLVLGTERGCGATNSCVRRIVVYPPYHTGGPWRLEARDTSAAHLEWNYGDSKCRVSFNSSGEFCAAGFVRGTVLCATDRFIGGNSAGAILASAANGRSVILRPNGSTCTTGQMCVNTSGNVCARRFLVTDVQGTGANALTRKDYVDACVGCICKYLNIAINQNGATWCCKFKLPSGVSFDNTWCVEVYHKGSTGIGYHWGVPMYSDQTCSCFGGGCASQIRHSVGCGSDAVLTRTCTDEVIVRAGVSSDKIGKIWFLKTPYRG